VNFCNLTYRLNNLVKQKKLDIIDHRAWSPRGVNTTLVNEVYTRAKLQVDQSETSEQALHNLLEDIHQALEKVINQPEAKIKVQRWFPGVVEEICEEINEKSSTTVTQRLLSEASYALERKQKLQTSATEDHSIAELLGGADVEKGDAAPKDEKSDEANFKFEQASKIDSQQKPRRRVRQKMRSTPVVGGGLFGETIEAKSGRDGGLKLSDLQGAKKDDLNWSFGQSSGYPAEITVKGEIYRIRVSKETFRDLKKGFSGQMVDSRGIEISNVNIAASDDTPVVQKLSGFVRNMPLNRIQEFDEESEISGDDTSSHLE
jgi:hypothetical protein